MCHAAIILLFCLSAGIRAQDVTCATAPSPAIIARAEGLAEPVGDAVITCTGGTPGPSSPIQLTVQLNTNLTSRIVDAPTSTSEALLLIDEPQPDGVNMSNGYPYNGQVLGTPGVAAGAIGSGNVYLGQQASLASVTWSGIPLVAPGAHREPAPCGSPTCAPTRPRCASPDLGMSARW